MIRHGRGLQLGLGLGLGLEQFRVRVRVRIRIRGRSRGRIEVGVRVRQSSGATGQRARRAAVHRRWTATEGCRAAPAHPWRNLFGLDIANAIKAMVAVI